MPIFSITQGKLKKLNAIQLDKEKTLQKLVEENLKTVLDLEFLATEYATTFGGRIDTLAVDSSGSPVIIEYKRNKNDNVINQALSYLKWLKSQKPGFFEKLIQDKLGQRVSDSIVLDWSSPRVICIAESYSKFDIDTAEVVPLRIELLRYRYYDGDIFSLEPVAVDAAAQPYTSSSKTDDKSEPREKTTSLEDLVSKANLETQEAFHQLRERIMAIDESIEEKPNTLYVAYRSSKNFAEVNINKTQLKIHLRPISYVDPQGMVEKIPDGYNWTMDRRVYLKNKSELDYVFGLIEQSYKDVI